MRRPKHGGARPGAGRPRGKPTTVLSVRVTTEAADRVTAYCQEQQPPITTGDLIRRRLSDLLAG